MIYREFWTESAHISNCKFTPDTLFGSMANFFILIFSCKSDTFTPFRKKLKSESWILANRISQHVHIGLFSISFWFVDVDQMQGKNGNTEVLV